MGMGAEQLFSAYLAIVNAWEQGNIDEASMRDNLAILRTQGTTLGLIPKDVKWNPDAPVADLLGQMGRGFEQQFPGGLISWARGEYAGGTKEGMAELAAGHKMGLGEYRDYARETLGLGEERMTDLLGRYGTGAAGLRDEFGRETAGLMGRAERRYETGMGMLEGMGEQERKDIREEYQGEMGRTQADLTSRGLSGTTIAPSMRAGLVREQTGALGRLEDRIRQQRLTTHAGLSGDVLSLAAQRSQLGTGMGMDLFAGEMGLRMGLTGEQLAAESQFGAGEVNLRAGQRGERFNWRTGRRAGEFNLNLGLAGDALNLMQSPNVSAAPMDPGLYERTGYASVDPWTPEPGGLFGMEGQGALPFALGLTAADVGITALTGGAVTMPMTLGTFGMGYGAGSLF